MSMSVPLEILANKYVLTLKAVSSVVVGVDIQLMAVDVMVGVNMTCTVYVK